MIPLSVLVTGIAIAWTVLVCFANSMRDGDGEFVGGDTIVLSWLGVAVLWIAAIIPYVV